MLQLFRIALLGLVLFSTACRSSKVLLAEHATDLREARTVATAFYQDFGKDLGLKDVPFVTVGVEGGTGYSYDEAHNVLFITPFEHTDFDTQKFFARVSQAEQGAATYNSIMFEYFTAHQLMHLLYDKLPLAPVSQYEEELRINVLAWVFLRKHRLSDLNEAQWLAALSGLEQQLVSRFPQSEKSDNIARALTVDNNASYWYVSAVSLQEAFRLAQDYSNERAYVNQLTGSGVAAAN